MRDTKTWRTDFARELANMESVYGPLKMSFAQFLDTELILTLMNDHLPGQNPELAWAILGGHPFPALEQLSEASQRALALVRLRLPDVPGRSAWERNLSQYRRVPAPYPLYTFDGTTLTSTDTSVLPERLQAMRGALETPPAWLRRPPHAASPGVYRFYLDRDPHEVEIPTRAVAMAKLAPRPIPEARTVRPPLRVTLDELEAEADWMDVVAPEGSIAAQDWGRRIRNIRLQEVTPTGLLPGRTFTINGLFHLVGILGSGKSSLFMVLAVHLAKRGLRVAIVMSDVASLLRSYKVFEEFRQADARIRALPLIGRSTRVNHLNRLMAAEMQRVGPSLSQDHPGYALLSTICGLDGLRRDVVPITPGQEPCTSLYLTDREEGVSSRFDCPLMPCCPVHAPTRSLFDANVWFATPASLLASSPQAPLIPEEVRYAELAMRTCDVVLVDEADLVQVQFDTQFAQVEVLVGHTDSWLGRLAPQVARQVYRPGRPLVGMKPGLDRWLTAHTNTQRAVDRLYRWLRESLPTRNWLSGGYFTGRRLLQRVRMRIVQNNWPTAIYDAACETFVRNPFGSGRFVPNNGGAPPEAWVQAVQAELFAGDATASLELLAGWVRSAFELDMAVDRLQIEAVAHYLRVALIVSVLDHALQELIDEWPSATEEIDLDRGAGGLFFSPSDSLARLVPDAPMGAVLGFQYFDPERRGNGELRFFRVRGLGRALLYRLHDALRLSDTVAGPHVILTSGTSFAPTSWRYDLHIPPDSVLLPQHVAKGGNGNATASESVPVSCFFEPLQDPSIPERSLAVSAVPYPQRLRNLRAMVTALAQRQGFDNRSLFEKELALLDAHRQRILLVVGRYEEADEVATTLSAVLGNTPGEDVVALVREQDGEVVTMPRPGTLLRSMLSQFPNLNAKFLVAPLQSIERGHNILVGEEAAFGSVYFLVRPLPVPGDPYTAIQRVNAWAARQVPLMTGMEITQAGKMLREQSSRRWDEFLSEKETYMGAPDRTALLWTQLVLVWQCIGRLLRGGVGARVHFIDAKWAEVTSGLIRGAKDTERTSMLLGFRRILREALSDSDPARRAVAEVLYGPFAAALENLEGVWS